MRLILLSLISIHCLFGQQFQAPPPEQDTEGLPLAQTLGPMIFEDPDPARLLAAAEIFMDDNRPHQAKILYEAVLTLEPKNQAALAGINKVDERLKYLENRYQEFKARYEAGGPVQNLCSMAAIKFHQGYPEEALEITKNAAKVFPGDQVPVAAQMTFQQGVDLDNFNLDRLEKAMELAAVNGKPDEVATLFGRMLYIGLGKSRTFEALKNVQAVIEKPINEKTIQLLGRLQAFHQNQGAN
ncbi:MAG: hypothetical protein H6510_00990 [Acidobacteria bacterium]|nr:hypothetical protein [Acidobacteriota bacterium]MCB9396364.1 hypothetical protein [Acidobacteriota bacterium]